MVGYGTVAAAGVSALLNRSPRSFMQAELIGRNVVRNRKEAAQRLTPEYFRNQRKAELRAELENRLDERCRTIAVESLAGQG